MTFWCDHPECLTSTEDYKTAEERKAHVSTAHHQEEERNEVSKPNNKNHFKNKKVCSFHEQLRDKHLKEFNETKKTICNSPFIRYMIYQELRSNNTDFKTRIVTQGGHHKSIQPYTYRYNPKVVMMNLNKGRYDKGEILQKANTYYGAWVLEIIDPENIEKLFDDHVSNDEKFKMVSQVCDYAERKDSKCWLFDSPRKTIKEIYQCL